MWKVTQGTAPDQSEWENQGKAVTSSSKRLFWWWPCKDEGGSLPPCWREEREGCSCSLATAAPAAVQASWWGLGVTASNNKVFSEVALNSSSSPKSSLTGPVALTKMSLLLLCSKTPGLSTMPELVPASPCMSSWDAVSIRVRSTHSWCTSAALFHGQHPLRLPWGTFSDQLLALKGSFSAVVMGMLSLTWREGYWSGSTPRFEPSLDLGSAWKHLVLAAVRVILKSGWWIQLAIKRLIFTLIADYLKHSAIR